MCGGVRCYVLDVQSLHWISRDTHAVNDVDDPGARSLHCTTVSAPNMCHPCSDQPPPVCSHPAHG